MATAGKILIIPKGKWNPSDTYEMLDMVNYNGVSWVAKEEVVGIEPSEANAEYWQCLFDTAVLPSAVEGSVETNNVANGEWTIVSRLTLPADGYYIFIGNSTASVSEANASFHLGICSVADGEIGSIPAIARNINCNSGGGASVSHISALTAGREMCLAMQGNSLPEGATNRNTSFRAIRIAPLNA